MRLFEQRQGKGLTRDEQARLMGVRARNSQLLPNAQITTAQKVVDKINDEARRETQAVFHLLGVTQPQEAAWQHLSYMSRQSHDRDAQRAQVQQNMQTHVVNPNSPFAKKDGFWGNAREHMPEEIGATVAVISILAGILTKNPTLAIIGTISGSALAYGGYSVRRDEAKHPYGGTPLPKDWTMHRKTNNPTDEGGEK